MPVYRFEITKKEQNKTSKKDETTILQKIAILFFDKILQHKLLVPVREKSNCESVTPCCKSTTKVTPHTVLTK